MLRKLAENHYRWARCLSGWPLIGEVKLVVSPLAEISHHIITTNFEQGGFYVNDHLSSQPDSPANEIFVQAVRQGIQYALTKTSSKYQVSITGVYLLLTDATPTAAGYTAIRACWDIIGFAAPEEEISRLEALLVKSRFLDTVEWAGIAHSSDML
ncbi:MAG: hypothetical protein JO154_04080 [Chitinophaga sp.]|uniref:hypothetical protein n=1 Tax=Chitinophaga sp. TaxID=1869181 RepID=UPI0025BC1345|nr:hypothetical protein [Chitinophaga sp.]MBV8251764.1 hypothetical protein [Chitinophaga sp.]